MYLGIKINTFNLMVFDSTKIKEWEGIRITHIFGKEMVNSDLYQDELKRPSNFTKSWNKVRVPAKYIISVILALNVINDDSS